MWHHLLKVLIISSVASGSLAAESSLPPPCDNEIYCHGKLLHTVQMAKLFNDSKHFVDMSLVKSPEQTLQGFDTLMKETKDNPTKQQVQDFVDEFFKEPGSEFSPWDPEDWQPSPNFLSKIEDPDLRSWGNELHKLWKDLGRKISPEVRDNPEKYSQIYVPNPVIVPGGRFREFYYWDSYWTIEGLLLSNMTETVKGMLQNFIEMVKTYKMVPNGGRIYYTRRSQPPFLIPMFKLYLDYTQDYDFVKDNLEYLESEFLFWRKNRKAHLRDETGKVHEVYQYNVQVGGPRPESYREDYSIAENMTSDKEKDDIYVQFKSGAESGWDYSTRWFVKGETNQGDLSDLNVVSIVPVDLNSLICHNAEVLSEFYSHLGDETKSKEYEDIATGLNQTIAEVFWDEEDGVWYDVNIQTGKKRRFFYLSNIHPLWGGCYGYNTSKQQTIRKVINYFKKEKVDEFSGGVPTSLNRSGEQWDFPNAWAPLQHIAIMGLHKASSFNMDAERLAFDLAEKWIRTNYKGYQQTIPNAMFEKYDVTVVGAAGGAGEYDVQLGFGWTNGVAIKLLDQYGDRLTSSTSEGSRKEHQILSYFVVFSSVAVYLVRNLLVQP